MKFEYYQGVNGWFWRIRARNGRILADGAEAYTKESNCLDAVMRINNLFLARLPVRKVNA